MIIYYTHDLEDGREASHRLLEKAISHSAGSWAVLICDSQAGAAGDNCRPCCGLDIQYPMNRNLRRIAERFYSADDAALATDEASFFRIWTRREALVKAVGGSVCAGDIPSVSADHVIYQGQELMLEDIRIPDADELYAAVCYCGGAHEGQDEKIRFKHISI